MKLPQSSREDVLDLLAEAAEIEHNLMCCYLYAIFGLKRFEADGLRAGEVQALARWRASLMSVAIEEMTHLALVANLICALGGRPLFTRPNFPIAPGNHPADVVHPCQVLPLRTVSQQAVLRRIARPRRLSIRGRPSASRAAAPDSRVRMTDRIIKTHPKN